MMRIQPGPAHKPIHGAALHAQHRRVGLGVGGDDGLCVVKNVDVRRIARRVVAAQQRRAAGYVAVGVAVGAQRGKYFSL